MLTRLASGTAVYISAQLKDPDNNLIDPDSIKCAIYDSEGRTKQAETDMTKKEMGKYYYVWQSASEDTGPFTVTFKAVKDNFTSINKAILFELE